jgi:hypothetical protein
MTDNHNSPGGSEAPPEGKEPSLAEQIAVFVAAAVLSGFAMKFIEAWALQAIVQPPANVTDKAAVIANMKSDIGEALALLPFLVSIAALGIWIGIYTMFAALPVRKVMPWLWAVGGLYVAGSILLTAQSLSRINLQPPIGYYISVTGGMVVLIVVFQAWFTKKGRIPPRQ